jgi:hypothetical protein
MAFFRNFKDISKYCAKIDPQTKGSTGIYYMGVYAKEKRVLRKCGTFGPCAFFTFLKKVIVLAILLLFWHILGIKNPLFYEISLKYRELYDALSYFSNQCYTTTKNKSQWPIDRFFLNLHLIFFLKIPKIAKITRPRPPKLVLSLFFII